MVNNNEKTTFSVVAEEHIREAERLKKAWFDHVLSSLEKINDNVNQLSSELHEAKDVLFKDIMSTKEALRNEIAANKSDINDSLDKLEKRIDKAFDRVDKSIDSMEVQAVKDDLKKGLEDLRAAHNKDMKELRSESLPLRDSVTKINVKFALLAVLAGIVGSAIMTGIIEWVVHISGHAIK